jgi:DNA recombination protein RmuC
LKGNSKTQGNWGEAILETILQNSGLERNRHYAVQDFLKDDAGQYILGPNGKKMQPDVTITYPDNRKVIIDSKVSLLAYEQFFSASEKEVQEAALKNHLKSIKTHIDQLSAKQYDGYAKVLDFVIMFVPMEAAYITAVQADPTLWEYAYKKRILLISSSNLIAALKMIKDLWVRTDQTKNALEIADRGGKLYDKFVSFLGNLEEIGKHLEKSQTCYGNAMKQLKTGSGNLIGQVEKLKKLGVKTSAAIPESLLPD